MKIHFIGTGSGKTSLTRNHSSILISFLKHNLLIDAGEGISKALLSQNINYNSIDSILFTHFHADHFTGIASLITQMKLTNRKNQLVVYTHEKLIEPLMNFLNTCYLFKEKLSFDFTIKGFEENEKIIINEEINFTAKQNSHIKKTEILKSYNQINFISCSFYFEARKKKIIYTSDIGSKADLFLFKEKNADDFITETSHISLEEIYNFYKTENLKRLFLTHIDDENEGKISGFISKLSPADRKRIFAAADKLSITC